MNADTKLLNYRSHLRRFNELNRMSTMTTVTKCRLVLGLMKESTSVQSERWPTLKVPVAVKSPDHEE